MRFHRQNTGGLISRDFQSTPGFRNSVGFFRRRYISGLKSTSNFFPLPLLKDKDLLAVSELCGRGRGWGELGAPHLPISHKWDCKGCSCVSQQGARCIFRPFQKFKKGFWWQPATDNCWQEDWCVFSLCQEFTLLDHVTEHTGWLFINLVLMTAPGSNYLIKRQGYEARKVLSSVLPWRSLKILLLHLFLPFISIPHIFLECQYVPSQVVQW